MGCSRGGGNWGTLRIPRKDWGIGDFREHWGRLGESPPPPQESYYLGSLLAGSHKIKVDKMTK